MESQEASSSLPTLTPFLKVEFMDEEPAGEGLSKYSMAVSFWGIEKARLPEVLRFVADGLEEE